MTKYSFAEQFLYTVDPKFPKAILDEMFEQCKNFQYETSTCLLYTSPSPRDVEESRMPSSA